MAPTEKEELSALDRKLSILELALAPHHDSDKCVVCRSVTSIKDYPTESRVEDYVDMRGMANSSNRHMILKYHQPSVLQVASGLYFRLPNPHKADIVLVTIGNLFAWKLRVYQLAEKDPTWHPGWRENDNASRVYHWWHKNPIAPSVYPNVCNARSPRA